MGKDVTNFQSLFVARERSDPLLVVCDFLLVADDNAVGRGLSPPSPTWFAIVALRVAVWHFFVLFLFLTAPMRVY